MRQSFGIDSDLQVPAFSQATEYVPEIDDAYRFDRDTTLAILAGFAYNRRVMIQGYHGTGKSTHIEQVAAHLNWPCVRVNLDSHISRIDLIGKDAIVLRDGKQVTEYREGMLPWALQHPVALVFDEYDAGRPDVMFVIQRVLEVEGRMTLLDQNRVIRPHRRSGCSRPPTRSASATPAASTTAPSRSTRARWTAGTSSPSSTIWSTTPRSRSCCAQVPRVPERGGPQDALAHGQPRRSVALGLHRRRHLDRDVAAHRDHLGRERARSSATSASPSA